MEKLPGVGVDHDGNVKVNGKEVSKLMVDGEDFFGGDTKLGVKNIPSDAVEDIQAIDHYNEVPFMKDLSDSDQMALNVKLKKDKKRFIFGESEAGGGTKRRYYLHPTIFYYSPETTLNFIGSLNNVNESPLDFDDIMRFKGGTQSFIEDPIESGDAGLMQFSQNENIRHKKTTFGAANWTQKFSDALKLEAYSIAAGLRTRAQETNSIDYLTQNSFTEKREQEEQNKSFGNYNKLKLRYTPTPHTDMAYDLIANVSNQNQDQLVESQLTDSTNHIHTTEDPHNMEISQYFRYNAQPTYTHTSELKAQHTYEKKDYLTNWSFDKPIFSDIIPLQEEDEEYNILHDYSSVTNKGRVDYKHYWVLNNTNHIYPKTGLYFFNQTYNSFDYQKLQNGAINNFESSGFNNDLQYQLIDPYIGLQYKFKVGKAIFRPGLMYHHYFWRNKQFDKRITDENTGVFLPEFMAEYEPNSSKKLKLNYNLKSKFADAEDYANRLSLIDFNKLYRGNKDLKNSLYHDLSLNYRHFNLSKGLNYYIDASYKRREKSIRHTTNLEGIDQIGTTTYTDSPENSYLLTANATKRW